MMFSRCCRHVLLHVPTMPLQEVDRPRISFLTCVFAALECVVSCVARHITMEPLDLGPNAGVYAREAHVPRLPR